MPIKKVNWKGYPPYQQSVYDQEEYTALELAGRTTQKINEVIDQVNLTEQKIFGKEDKEAITQSRKLSPSGNFTGTIAGKPASLMIAELVSNSQKISYLAGQFSDGQTGLVIDGGYFEESGIKKNYDGGVF